MRENPTIKIKSRFGHEIFAVTVAKILGMKVLICPEKDDKAAYEEEAQAILSVMSFFYDDMRIVPFCARNLVQSWDIVADLRSGKIKEEIWDIFFSDTLEPQWEAKPYYNLSSRLIGFVPQKLVSDGGCGITAAQQSVDPSVLDFLKDEDCQTVLLQHFNKTADLPAVQKLADEFGAYVPGLTENIEVLGMRGVPHAAYYNLYKQLYGSVGIAGTHTWYLLAMFPGCRQIILYNRNGVEDWAMIAASARLRGRKVWAIGFDDSTNMADLREKVKACYYQHFLH